MKPTLNFPAEYYLDMIRKNIPFQLSRFGDGEIISMKLAPHSLKQNCDGSKFLPEIAEPMRQIFRNNYPYYHCALDCTFNEHGEHFRKFIEETCPDIQFYNGEFWQHLSFEGRITELMEAISPYKPVIVGGKHLSRVMFMKGLNAMSLIETPSRDSFTKFADILNEIMNRYHSGDRMFLFCTGYTSKILIDTLYPYIGYNSFLLDMGSVFDPYCGKLSRDGMKYYGYERFQPYTNLKLS